MTTPPDIVVVLTDQQRPDSCGVFGQQLPVTPELDRLASSGVAFDDAFTVQPLCGPSRAVLQTGLMPTSTGCWRNGRSLPLDAETLAARLAALGYWTGYIGKWHLASDGGYLPGIGGSANRFATRPVPPERRGGYADEWIASDALEMTSGPTGGHMFNAAGESVELTGYRVDAITDLVLDVMARRDDDRPRLLFVSYLEPHHQNNRLRSVGPAGWSRRFADFEVPADLAGRMGDWRWNYAEYLACCASIDVNLGRIVDAITSAGRFDDTLLVFSSDHGSHFRTRNLEYKRSAHDASIRVPLVVRGPGFTGGRRTTSLVSNLDLVPTLVEAAGGDADASSLHGEPLQRVVDGRVDRSSLLVQISESEVGRALRTSDATFAVRGRGGGPLARYRRPRAESYVEHLVYDVRADPAQRHNLAGTAETADLRRELATQLVDEIERLEGHRPEIVLRRGSRVPARGWYADRLSL